MSALGLLPPPRRASSRGKPPIDNVLLLRFACKLALRRCDGAGFVAWSRWSPPSTRRTQFSPAATSIAWLAERRRPGQAPGATIQGMPVAAPGAVSPDRQSPGSTGSTGTCAHQLWLAAAVGLALFFGARSVAPALHPDIVQDDVRLHVFWMARLRDPAAFPNDPIADYFESVAPFGYRTLYQLFLFVHWLEPIQIAKLLPLPLAALTGLFVFLFTHRLHPSAVGALLASALASWYAWQYDDLASGTPRSFVLPFLAALLWALAAGRRWLAVLITALSALFYPVGGALGLGLLGLSLLRWSGGRPRLSQARGDWLALLLGGLLIGAALVPSQLRPARFGPRVDLATARTMPEFSPGGKTAFFYDDPYLYWIVSPRAGFDLTIRDVVFERLPIFAGYLGLGLLLPLLWLGRQRLPAVAALRPSTLLLVNLVVVSVGLFLLAHLLLFELYLPSRYVKWSVPLALAVAGGLALGLLIEAAAARAPRYRLRALLAITLVAGLVLWPARYSASLRQDRHPTISAYLRTQPRDSLVAGSTRLTNQVPIFAGLSVQAAQKVAAPFHLGYYEPLRTRIDDLIQAYYTALPGDLLAFADHYDLDLFLVDRLAFGGDSLAFAWTGFPDGSWEPYTSLALRRLRGSSHFALLEFLPRCAELDDGVVAVIRVDCLRDGVAASNGH